MSKKANFISRPTHEEKRNSVALIIQIFAILTYIGGIILGCVLANTEFSYYLGSGLGSREFSYFEWSTALIIWVAAFFSGTLLLGFAEIINLLQSIRLKGYEGKYEEVVTEDEAEIASVKIFGHRPEDSIVCPLCSTKQAATRNICLHCGAKFEFEE